MDNLTVKQKYILLIVVLVLLIVGNVIFKAVSNKSNKIKINYKNENGVTLVQKSLTNSDYSTYVTLNDIVQKYFESYLNSNNKNVSADFVSYMGYYDVLSSEYKKYLSKNKYLDLSKHFFERYFSNFKKQYENISDQKIINKIYTFDTDRYICLLTDGNTDNSYFLGIELNPNYKTWNIFYIE
ncbi:MAG: hypothetical protein N2749_02445 [Clostridia bacterium]|nr:hypothetical protein [Clostridia bacterium]